MPIDPRTFHRVNMIDTCTLWNVLSSNKLYQGALSTGCVFSCTGFVIYQCLHKPRLKADQCDTELQRRLMNERVNGSFKSYPLALEDLQEVEILEKRNRLGKGELSSIAYAKRTGQAFLTDDQQARKLALEIIPGRVQTTPHLFGWLVWEGILNDSDKTVVIAEHEQLQLPLCKHFEEVYLTVKQYRSFSAA
jgi:hypothetical protein